MSQNLTSILKTAGRTFATAATGIAIACSPTGEVDRTFGKNCEQEAEELLRTETPVLESRGLTFKVYPIETTDDFFKCVQEKIREQSHGEYDFRLYRKFEDKGTVMYAIARANKKPQI